MMQQGLPTGHLLQASMNIALNGDLVKPTQVSIEREFSDGLPGGGSFTSASGEVTFLPGEALTRRVPTPWNPGPGTPMIGDAVTVSMDVGLGPVSLLPEGRVADTEAGTTSREASASFVDLYSSLDRDISWEPIASRMPAVDGEYWRNPGLFGVSIVDRIFRHCGWYATPPMDPGALVSAPMQGSAWPEVGTLTRAERLTVPGAAPGWIVSPWGMLATDLNLTYEPSASRALSSGAFEITAMLPPSSGTARVVCWFGGRRIQLTWTDASVLVSAETGANSFTQLVSLARTPEATAVTARITRRGAGLVQAAIRTNAETHATGTDVSMGDAYLTAPMSHATVYGSGRCGAFQVAQSTAWLADGWSPSAVIHAKAGVPNRLQVLPPVSSMKCTTLLEQLALAEFATYWIDEYGVMQWWDIDRLRAQPLAATLTPRHVKSFTWSQSLASLKSRAVVKWKRPLVSPSFSHRVELWRGKGESVVSGSGLVSEEIVTPPDDEVWLMPDLSFDQLSVTGDFEDYNRGLGSWYGGVYENTGSWARGLTVRIEQIGPAAYKLVTSTSSTGTVGTVLQKTPDADATSEIWAGHRNENLPVLRGKLKYTVMDDSTPSVQTGPAGEGEQSIDVGWFIQYEEEAQALANRYGAFVTVPQTEMSEVPILPAPGLQLGDKVELQDPQVTGLRYRGVLYYDSRTMKVSGDSLTLDQSIRFRPTEVTMDSGLTWEEWGTAEGGQWEDFGADHSTDTWTTWASSPLA